MPILNIKFQKWAILTQNSTLFIYVLSHHTQIRPLVARFIHAILSDNLIDIAQVILDMMAIHHELTWLESLPFALIISQILLGPTSTYDRISVCLVCVLPLMRARDPNMWATLEDRWWPLNDEEDEIKVVKQGDERSSPWTRGWGSHGYTNSSHSITHPFVSFDGLTL